MAKRLLFIINDPAFFRSHRLPLALGAVEAGYDVYIASPPGDAVEDLTVSGIKHVPFSLVRASMNPLRELEALAVMGNVVAQVKPDVMHTITIKPVLYGGLLGRMLRVPLTVSAISGLGYTFLSKGTRAAILRRGILSAFKAALNHSRSRVIFQNPDDRDLFLGHGILKDHQVRMIPGSGTDLSAFDPAEKSSTEVPTVLLPARMLWDKGVREFVDAATILKEEGHKARFVLSGNTDDQNPAAVPQKQLDAWNREGVVEWLPHTKNIADRLAQSHIVVLPSYREGFPKTLIDAAAAGRAIVTTDVPGCRDAIEEGTTGLLVPPKDSPSLAEAIESLLLDSERRREMGRAGRRLAEARYSIEDVVAQHLAIYAEAP